MRSTASGESVYPASIAYCTEVAIEGVSDIKTSDGDARTMNNDELVTRVRRRLPKTGVSRKDVCAMNSNEASPRC